MWHKYVHLRALLYSSIEIVQFEKSYLLRFAFHLSLLISYIANNKNYIS